MVNLTPKQVDWFLQNNPPLLTTKTNKLGQVVTFYGHPTQRDVEYIYARIDDEMNPLIGDTGFVNIENLLEYDGYDPILIRGKIWLAYETSLLY